MSHLTTLELFTYLYGAIGGWFGLAAAYYLSQIRSPPAKPTTVVAFVFAGLAMLMGAINLLLPWNPTYRVWVRLAVFTLLIGAEVAGAVRLAYCDPRFKNDLKTFIFEKPRLSRYVKDGD